MSEKSKGDTSSSAIPAASRVVKNPLLSASVTGLTFDDFPNKPLLLPAAPPVIHAPPPVLSAAPNIPPGIVNRESKSLVTLGQTSAIDNETLSEINLNSSADEGQPAQIDTNSNSLLEQHSSVNNDSILSQAASSFSALPSVASSVFSTFSKRIYSGSSSRECTPDPNANPISQLDIQPPYIQHTNPQPLAVEHPPPPSPYVVGSYLPSAPPLSLGSAPLTHPQHLDNLSPPAPPKLYTPTEIPTLPVAGAAPPSAAGQNTYRLSAKKKTYAPIPGFFDQSAQSAPTLDPSVLSAPLAFDNVQAQSTSSLGFPQPDPPYRQEQVYQPKQEERKGGLFSITNLVPSGVLQNLSGLVQSAAGTIAQTVKSDSNQQYNQYQQQQPQPQQQPQSSYDINYFGVAEPQASIGPYTPPSAFYPPTNDPRLSVGPEPNIFVPPPATSIPYPTGQPQQLGLPLLPANNLFASPLSRVESRDSSVQSNQQATSVPPPLGFDQFLSGPISSTTDSLISSELAAKPSLQTPGKILDPATITGTTQKLPEIPLFDINQTPSITSSALFFDPNKLATIPTQPAVGILPTSNAIYDPTQSEPVTFASQQVFGPPPTQFLDPSRQPTQSELGSLSTANPSSQTTVAPPTIPFFDPTKPAIFNPNPPPLPSLSSESTKPQFYNPNQPPLPTLASDTVPPPPLSHLSQSTAQPYFAQPVPPNQPPSASGQTTFRLQKGTRHYPLSTGETVPSFINQPLGQVPQTIFNPFATTEPKAEHSPALFVPTSIPNLSGLQSIPLFTPESVPKASDLQSVSLFATDGELIAAPGKTNPIGFFNPATNLTSELNSLQDSLIESVKKESQNADTSISSSEQSIKTVETATVSSILDTDSKPLTTEKNFLEQTIEAVLAEPQTQEKLADTDLLTNKTIDVLEQTLDKLELTETTQAANYLPPPPQLTGLQGIANPYRKELSAANTTTPTSASSTSPQSTLATFFTPTASDNSAAEHFTFFGSQPQPPTTTQTLATETLTASFFNAPHSSELFNLSQPKQTLPEPSAAPISQKKETVTIFPQLSSQTGIDSPALVQEPLPGVVAPPLGFDNLLSETIEIKPTSGLIERTVEQPQTQVVSPILAVNPKQQQQEAAPLNSFSNFFNKTSIFPIQTETTEQKLPHATSFFDSFASPQGDASAAAAAATLAFAPLRSVASEPTIIATPSTQHALRQQPQANEDQQIQNFFNNPPPQELGGGVGDLNYDLVHSGLAVKHLQTRSLTPASNLVEPPSSSCSDFSELNSSLLGQRQNLSAESSNKISPEENKTLVVETQAATAAVTTEEAKLESETTNLTKHFEELPEEILHALRMANLQSEKGTVSTSASAVSYQPAVKHWFYKRIVGSKDIWTPFSHYDSALLETSLTMSDEIPNIVAVEGGRYDVNIRERTKTPVYWDGQPLEVRRCSWFCKAVDSRYVPYEEETADLLEAEYKQAAESGVWHKKIIISMGEQVVFHGPTVIVHFQQQQNTDAWGGSSQTTTRPRVVKRDLDDFIIDQGESQRVDHLLFMVHGIGAACDLKMRTVEEVVDEFRSIAQQLVQSHYKNSTEMGLVGRVEVLPISWHGHLHSQEMGIDEKLKSITLESIPKLRNFTNDTLLDVLFYTSPTYCQKIMNTVAASINSVYVKYRQRHPDFSGSASLAGHSLGSLILFDLLCHQHPIKESEEQNMENPDENFLSSTTTGRLDSNRAAVDEVAAKQISYTMGPAGTGQPFIQYSQLIFQPKKFFALGSPIGMFVTIRGIDKLGLDFRLPTCPGFYNIFHPFDPVAYRIEALVNSDMSGIRPVLIPHHKGRKRMHLELKETMTRVGADLKQRFFDTFKTTFDSVNFLSAATSSKNKANDAKESIEKEMNKVLEMQMQIEQQQQQSHNDPLQQLAATNSRSRTDSTSTTHSDCDMVEIDFPLGKLNDSKRVDYVLQEAPLEFFNEYLFALSSHVCYWESEDTILFVMKEIYSGLGVSPDSQVPQQSMTIERPSSRNSMSQSLLSPTT